VSVASPMQLEAGKLPSVPRAGFATGNETEEGRAPARYVHTVIGTSSQGAWRGSSREGVILTRRHRRATLVGRIVTSLNACGRESEAKSLSMCGRCFRKRRLPCGALDVRPLPCDHLFCPDCAAARARPIQKKVLAGCRVRGKHFQFLTLTVPNVPTLTRELVRKLVKDFAKLRRGRVWKRCSPGKGTWEAIVGGVFSVECTWRPKTRTWHLHIHALIHGPRSFSKERLALLRAEWLRITGNAKYLKLQRLYRLSRRGKKIFGKADRKALRELVKYVTKAAAFAAQPALVDEFLTAFEGVRRVQAFGSFLGVLKDAERDPGDETESFVCRHCNGSHLWRDCKNEGIATRDEVELAPDGTWQLKFDFVREVRESVPDDSPPWALLPEWIPTFEQKRIEFAGAMPEKSELQPSLFVDAA